MVTLTQHSNVVRISNVAKARKALDYLTSGDRLELARQIMDAAPYDPDTFTLARQEAAQQFPHATRRQLREIAQEAAERVKSENVYRFERGSLRQEQIADAVSQTISTMHEFEAVAA
jgi:hypothetical protein